ncbi:MAG: hypothetical protein KAW61_09530, partial [candidate division Zixibacteria bacterium]|nr:hypothetical protein [candidate division Zixibacteria bacterium]
MIKESCFFSRSIILLALGLIIAMTATADDASLPPVEQVYTFSRPHIETVKIDGEMFDRAVIDDCPVSGLIGQPALPTKRARILLPYGQQLSNVEVVV